MNITALLRKIKFFVTMDGEQRKFHRIKKEFTHVGFKEELQDKPYKLVYLGLTQEGQERVEMLAITFVYLAENAGKIKLKSAISMVQTWLYQIALELSTSWNYRCNRVDFVESYLENKLSKLY